MIKLELFKEKNLDLVCPNPFEFLTELLGLLGYTTKEYNLKKTREDALETLKLLFELQVLDVHTWYAKPQLNNLDLSIIEKLNYINEIWFKEAKYPDFYNMMMFVSPDWYIDQTRELGLTMTTNWKTFVKENIGDLDHEIMSDRYVLPIANALRSFDLNRESLNFYYILAQSGIPSEFRDPNVTTEQIRNVITQLRNR